MARAPRRRRAHDPGRLLLVAGFQLLVALYGGFFGAGIGILMLAALGIAGERDIHRANALKSLAAGTINLCATGAFLRAGHVDATAAVVTAAGAVAGDTSGRAWRGGSVSRPCAPWCWAWASRSPW